MGWGLTAAPAMPVPAPDARYDLVYGECGACWPHTYWRRVPVVEQVDTAAGTTTRRT